MDARDLAASGQPTSALVYFETLLPQLVRRALLLRRCCSPQCTAAAPSALPGMLWPSSGQPTAPIRLLVASSAARQQLRHGRASTRRRRRGRPSQPPFVPRRLATTVADPHKQVQYNTLIKSLQEEQQLLKEMEATLADLQTCGSGVSSRVNSASTVRRRAALRRSAAALPQSPQLVAGAGGPALECQCPEPCCALSRPPPRRAPAHTRLPQIPGRSLTTPSRAVQRRTAVAASSSGAPKAATPTCGRLLRVPAHRHGRRQPAGKRCGPGACRQHAMQLLSAVSRAVAGGCIDAPPRQES
jgi:hypothetical protein